VSAAYQPALDFEAAEQAAGTAEALVIDLDGFEGPLHVLLALARAQKVDLLKLSITDLADQYLAFVHEARRRSFGLAADYLVMAAWLTFLKSRLLLPKPERKMDGQPVAEDMAADLAFRLAKLDAMRKSVEALNALPQTGRDVFVRGDPEAVTVHSTPKLEGDLYALVQAYAVQRLRAQTRKYAPQRRVEAYSLEDARTRLRELLPQLEAWAPLGRVAPRAKSGQGPSAASCVASTLSAGLEMVKEGALELRQLEAFAELYMRARKDRAAPLEQAA
jgi:segregation and condensation protein A